MVCSNSGVQESAGILDFFHECHEVVAGVGRVRVVGVAYHVAVSAGGVHCLACLLPYGVGIGAVHGAHVGGDGGFQFTATELAVAVQENIPVTIVLSNNNAYGAIRAGQDRTYGRRFGSDLVNPDFLKLAAAYGIPAVEAETTDQFAAALDAGISSGRLNLIELTVELVDP